MATELVQGAGNEAGRLQGTANANPDLFTVIMRGTAGAGKKEEDLEAATRVNEGPQGEAGEEKFEIGGGPELSDDNEDFLNGGGGGDNAANDQDNGIIVDVDNVLELVVVKRHKDKEESER